MADNTSSKEHARYTLDDEIALLAFLETRKSAAGDGLNFKKPDWTAAAALLNGNRTEGGYKTVNSCKAKYRQLRATYEVVKAVRGNSGWKWDDEKGADINPVSKGAWDDYVAAHPKAAPFRNKGWVHLVIFDTLGGAPARGLHVFRASQGVSVSQDSLLDIDSQDCGGSPPWGSFEELPDTESQIPTQITSEIEKDLQLSDEEEKQSSPPATPIPSRRKRPASVGPSTTKKPRLSANAQAFSGLNASFDCVATVLEKAFQNNIPTSPIRKTESMRLALEREKDWLSKRQMAALLGVFEREAFAAESYKLVQDDDELCKEWVCLKLNIPIE